MKKSRSSDPEEGTDKVYVWWVVWNAQAGCLMASKLKQLLHNMPVVYVRAVPVVARGSWLPSSWSNSVRVSSVPHIGERKHFRVPQHIKNNNTRTSLDSRWGSLTHAVRRVMDSKSCVRNTEYEGMVLNPIMQCFLGIQSMCEILII